MLSYAGLPLLECTPDIDGWATSLIDPSWTRQRVPAGESSREWLLAHYPRQEGPQQINVLRWPSWGAGRWAEGLFVADDATRDLLEAACNVGGVPVPQAWTFDDGVKSVTTYLYMLPCRPLTLADPKAGSLWLLTLVDRRFFWWATCSQIDVDDGDATWENVYADLALELGVTVGVDPVDDAYLLPTGLFGDAYRPVPLVLDAVAASCGQRLVFSLDGTITAQSADNSLAAHAANLETYADRLAGGTVSLVLDDAVDSPSELPESVTVVFGRFDSQDDAYLSVVTLLDLIAGDGTVADLYEGTVGFVGTKLVRSIALAGAAEPPDNQAELDALAAAIATDYYKHRASRADVRLEGVSYWAPEGLSWLIEYEHRLGRLSTRILRAPDFDVPEDMAQRSGVYGSGSGPSGGSISFGGTTILLEDGTSFLEEDGTTLGDEVVTGVYLNSGSTLFISGSTFHFLTNNFFTWAGNTNVSLTGTNNTSLLTIDTLSVFVTNTNFTYTTDTLGTINSNKTLTFAGVTNSNFTFVTLTVNFTNSNLNFTTNTTATVGNNVSVNFTGGTNSGFTFSSLLVTCTNSNFSITTDTLVTTTAGKTVTFTGGTNKFSSTLIQLDTSDLTLLTDSTFTVTTGKILTWSGGGATIFGNAVNEFNSLLALGIDKRATMLSVANNKIAQPTKPVTEYSSLDTGRPAIPFAEIPTGAAASYPVYSTIVNKSSNPGDIGFVSGDGSPPSGYAIINPPNGARIDFSPGVAVPILYDPVTSDWTALVAGAASGSSGTGLLTGLHVYTSTGGNTWTKPAGLAFIEVEVVGAGGGGGGGNSGITAPGGGAGGGGYSYSKIPAATLGATETATVGAGGAGGSTSGTTGGNGGNSTFTVNGGSTITAGGGLAGNGTTAVLSTPAVVSGDAGGAVTNANTVAINLPGGGGGPGLAIAISLEITGAGGGSGNGMGAGGYAVTSGAGNPGSNYGGGGGGGAGTVGAGQAGGAGANGIIIVREYS